MLKGIRIIDFSNYLPGPYASQRLAELGAEVIKIECLEGDPARHLGLQKDGTGLLFLANNRHKKSITLNLKMEEGKQIALELISNADAILESFRPGIMKKLGLDYESVRVYKPDIVYCSLTGYGNNGSFCALGSHDLNYMGVSGVLAQLKDCDGRPIHPTTTLADFYGGYAASERLLGALLSKSLTGKGSYHCISIAEVMASIMGNHLVIDQETGDTSGISLLNGQIISYAIYETKDNRYVTLAALEPKFWHNFCHSIDKEVWLNAHYSKTVDSNPVFEQMKNLFKSRNLEEWIEFGQKVDCCLAPVLEVNELKEFPLYQEKNTVFNTKEKLLQVKMHGDLTAKSETAPPAKGQHTEEMLKELLGVSEKQLVKWKEEGIFA